MSSIAAKFSELRGRGEKALVLFVTAGDPSLADLPGILSALCEGGADLIEVGIPYSDPVADGPTIQASTQRALNAGTTPAAVFELVGATPIDPPLVAMGYYNTILRLGLDSAAHILSQSGFAGSIVTDLTPEESGEWRRASGEQGLDTIFLAAPTSTDARLDRVCAVSTGFVYAVSRTGVTSELVAVPPEAGDLVKRIKGRTDLPVCVGFGISKPEHVRMVCEVADGAVIGSRIVDKLFREWNGGEGRSKVVDMVKELKASTR